MESIQDALRAWRAAERRLREIDGHVPFEVHQELIEARQRYQRLAAAHTSDRIEAALDAEWEHPAVGSSPEVPGRL